MSTLAPVSLAHFGKIPSRGDFIRSHSQTQLIATMDQWLSQALEVMAQDAHWKACYDQARPLHFAFLSPASTRVLAGHLAPSSDQSGRRFPLVTLGTFEVGSPQGFTARAPMAINKLWLKLENAVSQIRSSDDPSTALADYARQEIDIDTDPAAYDASYRDFLELQTVGSLQAMLGQAGHEVNLRLSLLALGMLLESIPGSGNQPIEKGLCLPLPADRLFHPYVATLWLELISRFLTRSSVEVAVFLPQATAGQSPMMYIGFSGGSAQHLSAMLDTRTVGDHFIDIRKAAWAEADAEANYGSKKLSSYLQQPQLSLLQAVKTFREAFLGE
jgi:type VI secretion system protein ImpM